MVKTAMDVLDSDPLERMKKLDDITMEKKGSIAAKKKELEEFEKEKKREIEEIDQKKRRELEELDKKRKELQELESQKIREIEETQRLIDASFQDLMRHKRQLLQEADEEIQKQRKHKNNDEKSLEEITSNEPKIIPDGVNTNYNKFFENLQQPQKLYDVTNNGFYSNLTDLRNKAANGQITPEEELFVERLKNQFEQFNNNQVYAEKDQNQYIKRSLNVIDQIGKYQRLKID